MRFIIIAALFFASGASVNAQDNRELVLTEVVRRVLRAGSRTPSRPFIVRAATRASCREWLCAGSRPVPPGLLPQKVQLLIQDSLGVTVQQPVSDTVDPLCKERRRDQIVAFAEPAFKGDSAFVAVLFGSACGPADPGSIGGYDIYFFLKTGGAWEFRYPKLEAISSATTRAKASTGSSAIQANGGSMGRSSNGHGSAAYNMELPLRRPAAG